jgi:hypothetical protein
MAEPRMNNSAAMAGAMTPSILAGCVIFSTKKTEGPITATIRPRKIKRWTAVFSTSSGRA